MTPELQKIVDLVVDNKWLPVGSLIIGLIIRLFKDDTKFPTVPPRVRTLLALILGTIAAVIDKISTGTSYEKALLWGIVAASISIIGHDLFIEGVRNGKEIPLPKALLKKSNPSTAGTEEQDNLQVSKIRDKEGTGENDESK